MKCTIQNSFICTFLWQLLVASVSFLSCSICFLVRTCCLSQWIDDDDDEIIYVQSLTCENKSSQWTLCLQVRLRGNSNGDNWIVDAVVVLRLSLSSRDPGRPRRTQLITVCGLSGLHRRHVRRLHATTMRQGRCVIKYSLNKRGSL